VSHQDPKHPQFIAIDFGIVGILSPDDQHYLAENFIAFLNRDYRRVAELHVESGWVPATTRVDELEAAIRTVCEPMFERPLHSISFGQLLFRLFQTAARFQVNIQPQLILLQKTLINIEGLSRQLYPDIDLWGTAKPILEEWMKKQFGFSALFHKIKTNGPFWIEKLPELPNLVYGALTQLARARHPYTLPLPSHSIIKPGGHSGVKDICLGLLLGISLCLIGFLARSYF